MTKEDCFNAPKCAGIYLIRNKINGKCYIGQSIKLRKRLLDHFNHYLSNRYSNILLYKAFKKYGIENFELIILHKFIEALSYRTKSKLDELEKKYIKQYNSYGESGYNATIGGDYGVFGLIQTDKTKEVISSKGRARYKELEKNPENWIKLKNVHTGETRIYKSKTRAAYSLGVSISAIRNSLSGRTKVLQGQYISAKYLDEFKNIDNILKIKKCT